MLLDLGLKLVHKAPNGLQIDWQDDNFLLKLVLPASTSSAPAMLASTQTAELLDCDWSERTCPDAYKYYYNCITCESKVIFLYLA